MTTVAELRTDIYEAVGGREDSVVQAAALRGLNAGQFLYLLMFEPPECRDRTEDVTASSANDRFDYTTSLTRPLRIEKVTNESNSGVEVPFIQFHLWENIFLPTTGSIQYYSLHGKYLYYKPTPEATENLDIYFMQYPARLAVDADTWPYSIGEDFALSVATSWTQAVLEEGESAQVWNKLASDLGISESVLSKVRGMMREEIKIGDNVQGAISESSAAA